MTQSAKDELLKHLDTEQMRINCHYTVKAHVRYDHLPQGDTLKWEIRLLPSNKLHIFLDPVTRFIQSIAESISMFMDIEDNSCILLV